MLKLTQFCRSIALNNVRFLQTTQTHMIDQEWRRNNRLAMNPNRESPLTYLPDFTYMDGRPTPVGQRQKKRIKLQRKYTKRIVQTISEIDFAKERFARLQKEAKQQLDDKEKSKLKPKGFRLLKHVTE